MERLFERHFLEAVRKYLLLRVVMAHAFYPGTWEAEVDI